MAEDPIVQCESCGAKLRLKAASLKVLKQVRCGKCQATIKVPESLRSGDAVPNKAVIASKVDMESRVAALEHKLQALTAKVGKLLEQEDEAANARLSASRQRRRPEDAGKTKGGTTASRRS